MPSPAEKEGDDASVYLERVLEHEKAILYDLERRDQYAAKQSVEEDCLLH